MGDGELINITQVKRVKCWKVYAVRGDKVASKSFSDLAEAKEFRDAFISENPIVRPYTGPVLTDEERAAKARAHRAKKRACPGCGALIRSNHLSRHRQESCKGAPESNK